MGLSAGGLIRGEGGLYTGHKKASETTNIRKNENLYLNKCRKCIVLFVYLLIKVKKVPEIVPLWLKNRNQRVHMGGLMSEGGGAYTWSNTSVKGKVGLYTGAHRQINTVCGNNIHKIFLSIQ